MSRRRLFLIAATTGACGIALIAVGRALSTDVTASPIQASSKGTAQPRLGRAFLAFTRTPRRPGNVLARRGLVGRSAEGRPIGLWQRGDPAFTGELLVFGCIHGD